MPVTAIDTAVAGWVVSRRKSLVERLVAAVLVVPSTVVVLPIMLWSLVSFRANPIFRQRRIGSNGQPFDMIKLRTLPVSIPSELDRGELDEQHQTNGIARLLRASHLDEVPQICQVLSGKMSLVGPRPMIEPIIDGLDPDFRRFREVSKPGLTGLWQISVCGAERFERYDPLDVAYLQAATPRMDARILYWTIRQLAGAKRLGAEQIERSLGVKIDTAAGDRQVDETAREAMLRSA